MTFTAVILCASAILVQSITAQCIGNAFGAGLVNGLGAKTGLGLANAGVGLANAGVGLANAGVGLANAGVGLAGNNLNGIASGGGMIVTSSSPISPTGLSVLAENLVIEGPLAVGGQLPLSAAVALEGQVPAGGQAAINYGCGDGNVGIISEGVSANGLGAGIGLGGVGLNSGLGLGLRGCGKVY